MTSSVGTAIPKGCSHADWLLKRLSSMRDASELTDVMLLAGESSFQCHRPVLAAFSPYFRAMFTCGLSESHSNTVSLPDVPAESLSLLLHYMYSGYLDISTCTVQDVATAAFLFQMDGAFEVCMRFIMDNMDASNCVGILHFARHLGAEDLEDKARIFLHRHFIEACRHDEIMEVTAAQLEKLISCNDLDVHREEPVLDVVLRWAARDHCSRLPHLPSLLHHVRLMVEEVLVSVERSHGERGPPLRYGMEHTEVILCLGNDPSGIRTRSGSCTDASFCLVPSSGKICYIQSPRRGRVLSSVSAGIVCTDGNIVLAGQRQRRHEDPEQSIHLVRYKPKASQAWEQFCSAPYRELYALVQLAGSLYLLGGQAKEKNRYAITASVDRWIPEAATWRPATPLPVPLACHAAVRVRDHLFVMGGWKPQLERPDEEPEVLHNKLFCYDPESNEWSTRASMNFSRHRFGTAILFDEIYIIGGIGCEGEDRGQPRRCLDSVEIYNTEGDYWRFGPALPHPLLSLRPHGTNAVSAHGKVYVCGGFTSPDRHQVIQKDILEFDPWDGVWTCIAQGMPMHDDYDICLVAHLNPRDLLPPPSDLVPG
uniref:Kelch repeat and BTB (POZ) domain containing 12 n=1 Tax=Eptatretus burgeri TaxID=7764 RepID=A0A8C4R0S6_EPTBU